MATFAFGRTAGNIRPYTVMIASDGGVTVSGAQVGRDHVGPAVIHDLLRIARVTRFFSLPKVITCAGAPPDVAFFWIRIQGREMHTVSVRGGCSPDFRRLYDALRRAVDIRT